MAATSNTIVLTLIILAITFSSSSAANETQAPSPPPALTCTEELVMFSPCLPYVAAPPNNMSDTPDHICCSVFSTSVHSAAGNCLCYLLRQPMILGFPLDRSRLLSLSQICTDRSSDESFESLCSPSESPELPPLQSIPFTAPFVYGDRASASPPLFAFSPEAAGISPTSDQFSPELHNVTSSSLPPPSESIINGSPKITSFWFLSTIIMTLPTSIFTRHI
ncbi:Non-specific lipid transfer protein GPI-anchored 25 [Hirschfeldia incana]|nr:Non-specific lipid transfer protein GPI-anchored 25 [Hirschfeldia incana]